MLTLKKILLPTDFSQRSSRVALHARALARRYGAELVAMHVIAPFPVPDVFDQGEILESCQALGWSKLNEMYSDKSFLGQRLLMDGEPAEEIVNYANEQGMDLIMMAAGGGGLRRSLLGRVTAKTLDQANCPVWITAQAADHNGHSPGVPKNIVCAVDLDIGSEPTIRWAADVAVAWGSHLTVVHALADPRSNGDPDVRRHRAGRIREQISAMLCRSALPISDVAVHAGPVSDVVGSVAEERQAGLVVIGRPRSGKGSANTGFHRLVREAPCPVVSV